MCVLQIGLLGKANVGKSTFFSAATETPVPIGNFPFTTIQPNIGVAYVKSDCACKHFGIKHQNPLCVNGTRFIPVKLIDVAGLVPGAHEGKGLGNQFLDDARQAEVLIHVVDIAGATDIQGQPIPIGTHNPLEDVDFVENEFDQWFTDILRREWDKLTREIEQKRAKLTDGIAKRFTGLGIKDYQVQDVLHKLELISKNPKDWNDSDIHTFVKELRKNTKPIIIAANKADLPSAAKNLEKLRKEFPEKLIVPCSAEAELALKEAAKAGLIKYRPGDSDFEIVGKLNDKQKAALEFIRQNVLEKHGSTGVQQVLDASVFELLKYIAIFPGGINKLADQFGRVLPDCFLLPANSTALDFAFRIHTDLGNKFIRAIDVKTRKTVGKEHLLKNGDVVEIVTGR